MVIMIKSIWKIKDFFDKSFENDAAWRHQKFNYNDLTSMIPITIVDYFEQI